MRAVGAAGYDGGVEESKKIACGSPGQSNSLASGAVFSRGSFEYNASTADFKGSAAAGAIL
jgi:hypothetical protein